MFLHQIDETTFWVTKKDGNQTLAQNRIAELCARAGIKSPELARRIDMRPATLRTYIRGEREPRPALAEKLADALECSVNEIMGYDANGGPPPKERGESQIPLYGNAAAGLGADVTDVTSPVEYISAHPSLATTNAGYAVFIVGTSMEPRYREGEIVFVKPGKPPRAGDDVVVQIEDDRTRTAIVKEFVSADNEHVTLRQYNPDTEISLSRDSVVSIHPICGMTVS